MRIELRIQRDRPTAPASNGRSYVVVDCGHTECCNRTEAERVGHLWTTLHEIPGVYRRSYSIEQRGRTPYLVKKLLHVYTRV